MSNRNDILAWLIAIVTFVSSIFCIAIVQPNPVRNAALYVVGGCSLLWVALMLFRRPSLPPPPLPFLYEKVKTEAELTEAWTFGRNWYSSFGKPYPSQEVVTNWWRKYPNGITLLRDRKSYALLGYFSMWPLSQTAFKKISGGEQVARGGIIDEDQNINEEFLTPDMIESDSSSPKSHWYIADIIRKKKPRNAHATYGDLLTSCLMVFALKAFLREQAATERFEVVSFGATTAGRDLLKKYHFQKVSRATAPIFVKSWSLGSVRNALQDLCACQWKGYLKKLLRLG